MRMCVRLAAIATLALSAAATAFGQRSIFIEPAAPVTDAERCLALNELELPDLRSIEATLLPPGAFALPAAGPAPARSVDLPGFCRVQGVVSPAVRFEVWLPEAALWNGRFQAVGGGGFAGVISYGAMAPALQAGYATASTDTGHTADDLTWLGDLGRLRDYGYRAIYEMTSKAKAAVAAFYDRPADFNYFNGCSTGGRQGLMEAQRFPADYDGIVTGAPVNDFVDTHVTQLWVALAAKPFSDTSTLSAADLAYVNEAVLAQCDALDAVTDGVIEDPRACSFDPGRLQCGLAAGGRCLSAAQVDSLRKIYAGPVDPATGERLHFGLEPGGEPSWSLVTDPGLAPIPEAYFSRAVFADPAWNWRSFDFAADTALAHEQTGPILDATDPNLATFRDLGGKLIVYHGWNDQVIFPEGTIAYYDAVGEALAAAPNPSGRSVDDFFRLFMVPGMTHCRGGPGTDDFDAQRAIEDWVERGIAPSRIEASHVENGRVTATRPLCPYPETARYRGRGDTDSTESFVCTQ